MLLPGARPTSVISIEFEIEWNFVILLFIIYSTDHNEILHTSRHYYCCDVCKILLWSVDHILNQGTVNLDRISNSIEIMFVGQAPEWQCNSD